MGVTGLCLQKFLFQFTFCLGLKRLLLQRRFAADLLHQMLEAKLKPMPSAYDATMVASNKSGMTGQVWQLLVESACVP